MSTAVITPQPGPSPESSPAPGRATRRRALAAALAAQLLLLAAAVWPPLSARLTGQEVTLRVGLVDPVDPFRGAYVDLGYPDLPQPTATESGRTGGTVYVPLEQRGAVWVGTARLADPPASGVYLTCRDEWRLACGIESWFLPQDAAAAAETELRNQRMVAVVKVDGRGHAALVDLRPAP